MDAVRPSAVVYSVKNKFFTDEFIRLVNIVPAAQSLQAVENANYVERWKNVRKCVL